MRLTLAHPSGRRLPTTAWSAPFVLVMVALIIEIYLIFFLLMLSAGHLGTDFERYQRFLNLWTGEGAVERGLPFEVMKINLLLVVYLWVMSRGMRRRREAIHRMGLIGAAVVVLAFQGLLARSYDLIRPPFELVPIWRADEGWSLDPRALEKELAPPGRMDR